MTVVPELNDPAGEIGIGAQRRQMDFAACVGQIAGQGVIRSVHPAGFYEVSCHQQIRFQGLILALLFLNRAASAAA